MSFDSPDPEYLTHYFTPVIHDDLLDDFINRVKARLVDRNELLNDKDLFRVIGLLSDADNTTLKNAYRNRNKLKKGGIQDVLLNLVKELFIHGLLWEKTDSAAGGRDNLAFWSKLSRMIKIYEDDKKGVEKDDTMWSEQDHNYALRQQKEDLTVKHSDEKREFRRDKEKAEACAREWKKSADKYKRLYEKAEACNELPDLA